jgi:hypothetical protein
MNPDRRFEAVAAAIAALDDPTRRDADAVKLLGTAAQELIPALKGMAEATGSQIRLTEDQISGLSAVSNAFATLKNSIIPATVQFIDGATHASQFYEALKLLFGAAEKGPAVYGEAANAVDKWNAANKEWLKTNTIKVANLDTAMEMDRQFARSQKEKEEAAQREEADLLELAKAYEEYTKSVEMFQRFTFENQKKVDTELITSAKKRATEVNTAILAEFNAQVKLNEAYGLTATGTIPTVTSAYDVYIQKMAELHQHKMEGISQTAQEAEITREYTATLYEQATAQDAATAATTEAQAPLAAVAESMQAQTGSIRLNIASLEEYNAAIHAFYDQFVGSAGSVGTPGVGSYGSLAGPAGWNMPRMLGMADGGSIAAGQPAIVGERGPEVFVPRVSGTVVPSGGGTVNHFYITQPLGTPQQIAAAVGTAQMTAAKGRGERFRPIGV